MPPKTAVRQTARSARNSRPPRIRPRLNDYETSLGETPGNPFVISASTVYRKIKQKQIVHVHLAGHKGIDSGARNPHCVANTQHRLIFNPNRLKRNYSSVKGKAQAPIRQVRRFSGRRGRALRAFDQPLDVAQRRFRQGAIAEIENERTRREVERIGRSSGPRLCGRQAMPADRVALSVRARARPTEP